MTRTIGSLALLVATVTAASCASAPEVAPEVAERLVVLPFDLSEACGGEEAPIWANDPGMGRIALDAAAGRTERRLDQDEVSLLACLRREATEQARDRGFAILPEARIDRALADGPGERLRAVREAGADRILVARLTTWDASRHGATGSVRAGVEVALVDAATGAVVWHEEIERDYREQALPYRRDHRAYVRRLLEDALLDLPLAAERPLATPPPTPTPSLVPPAGSP